MLLTFVSVDLFCCLMAAALSKDIQSGMNQELTWSFWHNNLKTPAEVAAVFFISYCQFLIVW